MRFIFLFIYTLFIIVFFTSCNNANNLAANNNAKPAPSIDKIQNIITARNFNLVGDVKSVETRYYDEAYYSYFTDTIEKNKLNTKITKYFDKDEKIDVYITEVKDGIYTYITKNTWKYDDSGRVVEYLNRHNTQHGVDDKRQMIKMKKFEFLYDTNTLNLYKGNTENYCLVDSSKELMDEKVNSLYAEYLNYIDLNKDISLASKDADVYFSTAGTVDFRKSKKYHITNKDQKGNIVLSYITYDLKNLDGKIILKKPIITNYYEQKIVYNDGTTSNSGNITEEIDEIPFDAIAN